MHNEPKSEIFLGDCLDYMKSLPDKYFDITIADSPYGIDVMKSGVLVKEKGREYKGWDESAPSKEVFDEIARVSKNYILWGANHFIETVSRNASCWLVWDKVRPATFSFCQCELALTTFPCTAKLFRYSSALQNAVEEKIHPTQKPIALYSWILDLFAQPGDKIFDPFLGSGSSRIAAYQKGFDFVGCEMDEEYFRSSDERFKELCHGIKTSGGVTIKQESLF